MRENMDQKIKRKKEVHADRKVRKRKEEGEGKERKGKERKGKEMR